MKSHLPLLTMFILSSDATKEADPWINFKSSDSHSYKAEVIRNSTLYDVIDCSSHKANSVWSNLINNE